MKNYAADHPDPGERPPMPGPVPNIRVVGEVGYQAWQKQRNAHNAWVKAMRKHQVAVALDEMVGQDLETATPAERIAFYVGTAFLESDGTLASGLMSALFG